MQPKQQNWESLIASRSRPAASVCRIEDPVRRNRVSKCKRWRSEHPEYGADYYAEHRDKMLAASKAWKRDNPEKLRAQRKAWKQANPDKVREAAKRYRDKKKMMRLQAAA